MAFAGAVSFGLLAILAKRRSAPSNSVPLGDSLRMCKYIIRTCKLISHKVHTCRGFLTVDLALRRTDGQPAQSYSTSILETSMTPGPAPSEVFRIDIMPSAGTCVGIHD